jgi:hypothetical protein
MTRQAARRLARLLRRQGFKVRVRRCRAAVGRCFYTVHRL